ncbi:hypothetical protein Rhopal_005249-T1 [Rhodotorula paludigena]|uniref:ARID domain-containing protein n=1 Tax=Rhodotorula paludigena TaxID=86838 RepID=A0AAV5GQN0_9BASI|nr:hypothetical protein Rhopal_005249-T1 [Rhodotorula paludigena]
MYPAQPGIPQQQQHFDPAQYPAGAFPQQPGADPPRAQPGSAYGAQAPQPYSASAYVQQTVPRGAQLDAGGQSTAAMFGTPTQQQGQQGSWPSGTQPYGAPGIYPGGAYPGMQQQQQQPPSTSALFQQHLAAQQAAMGSSPAPNAYQNLAQQQQAQQQYMQNPPQPFQQTPARPPPSNPAFSTPSYTPAPPQSAAPQQQQTPSTYPQQQQQQQQRPPNQTMSNQELQAALRGVQLQGMTQERFQQLTPLQQAALREMMARSRAQQQAQLGLGMPGSPAAAAATGSPAPSGSGSATPARPPVAVSQANGVPAPPAAARPGQPGAAPQMSGPGQTQQNPMFLKALLEFHAKRNVPFVGPPVVEGRTLDLARLFAAVSQGGGFQSITASRRWGLVLTGLGFAAPSADQQPEQRVQAIQQAYQQSLLPFEQYWTQMQQLKAAQAQNRAAGSTPSAMAVNGPAGSPPASASTIPPSTAGSMGPSTPQQQPTRPSTATATRPASRAAATPAPAIAPSPAAMQPVQTIDLTGSAPSPALVRPGTAGAEDVKGKGKAEELLSAVKPEDGAFTATPPVPTLPSQSPAQTAADVKPTEPAAPPRRKRRRIEYAPLTRPVDTHGGYELPYLEAVFHRVDKLRPRRNVHELGTVDVHSLVMSLRCRLATEVSYALNVLATIAIASRREQGAFSLVENPEVVEELLDLLEDTAFGVDGEGDVEDEPASQPTAKKGPGTSASRTTSTAAPTTYRELFALVEHEANELVPPRAPSPPPDPSEEGLTSSLRRAEVIVAVVNLLRTFALEPDYMQLVRSEPRIVELLIRVASLPLRRDDYASPASRWPVRVSAADSMVLKKAALETLSTFGTSIHLDQYPLSSAQKALDLLLFFVRNPHSHREPFSFDLSGTPGMAARLPQLHAMPVTPTTVPAYLDLGLAAFARVGLLDANRSVIGRLIDPDELQSLFRALVQLLPLAEADFQLIAFDVGLVHVHNLAMTLYNLAFLAPSSVKARLRPDVQVVKPLLRVVRRLALLAPSPDPQLCAALAERCIATLQLLDDGRRPARGAAAAQQGPNAELPWWGLSMSGLDDDDDGHVASSPPPSATGDEGDEPGAGDEEEHEPVDEGTPVPAAEAATKRSADRAPILASEARALFEQAALGPATVSLPALVALTNASDGRGGVKKRKKAVNATA